MQRSSDGYNPCPPIVRDAIVANVRPATERAPLLDSCAGDGSVAAAFARAWNLDPFFIELDPVRAQQCAALGAGPVAVGSAENAQLDGSPAVWYFNPPWDPADPEGYLEHELLRASCGYALGENTLAVLILPARALAMPELWNDVAQSLEEPVVRAFPPPYDRVFEQLVIFGYARRSTKPPVRAPHPDGLAPLVAGELQLAISQPSRPLRSISIRI